MKNADSRPVCIECKFFGRTYFMGGLGFHGTAKHECNKGYEKFDPVKGSVWYPGECEDKNTLENKCNEFKRAGWWKRLSNRYS